MVDNKLGMVIGAAIDRRDGDSGIRGAIEGGLIEGAIRLVTPLAITLAIGWGVRYLARRAADAMVGYPDPARV